MPSRLVPESLRPRLTDPTLAPAERYVTAHRAAGRVALAVVSAVPRRPRGRHDVWELLSRVAPELGEWGAFFSYLTPRAEVAAAGEHAIIGEREADDLVRDLDRFTRDAARAIQRRRTAS